MVQCKSLINSRKSELNAVLNNNINIPGGGYQNRCKDIGNLDDNTKIYVFLKKLDNWRIFKDILEDINRIFYCINNNQTRQGCEISQEDQVRFAQEAERVNSPVPFYLLGIRVSSAGASYYPISHGH